MVFEREPTFLFPTSPLYNAVLVALAFVYWAVVPREWRRELLLLASVTYATLLLGWQVLLLGLLVGFAHLRARDVARDRSRRLAPSLAVLLGAFVLLKSLLPLAALIGGTAPLFVPIALASSSALVLPMGLSYCFFRLIHYLMEVHRRRLQPARLPDLALFVVFFPTFRAGPIERLGNFKPRESFAVEDVNAGLMRLFTGLAKKMLLADLLLAATIAPWLLQQQLASPWRELLLGYLLTLLVYFDFSGYSDLAIGAGRLFGYRIVENFHYPLLKANIAEFWRSWHVSLYNFMRDYFFFPLFGRATSFRKMVIGVFLTFVVSQLWHALSLNFLLVGAWHGLLMALWSVYDRWRKKHTRGGQPGALGRVLGAIFTLHLVAIGFLLFFWGRVPSL